MIGTALDVGPKRQEDRHNMSDLNPASVSGGFTNELEKHNQSDFD